MFSDPDHERVREVFEEFDTKRLPQLCLTANHVVFETITLTRPSSGHREAVSMGRRLYKERLARIHWATPEEEKKAVDYLVRHQDKGYSAVEARASSSWSNPIECEFRNALHVRILLAKNA